MNDVETEHFASRRPHRSVGPGKQPQQRRDAKCRVSTSFNAGTRDALASGRQMSMPAFGRPE